MALGMEVEIRLAVTNPAGEAITEGDTVLLEHNYFTLVTDKFRGYSNLEFVMKHFDQFRDAAAAALDRRLAAMQTLAVALYKGDKKTLGAIVGGLMDKKDYTFQKVAYVEKGTNKKIVFASDEVIIKLMDKDDRKLYIHYTIGFETQYWLQVVRDVAQATRDDTDNSRPKTHAENAVKCAESITQTLQTKALAVLDKRAMRGHLALLYMQMMVFVERTAELGLPELEEQKEDNAEEINGKKGEIEEFWEDLGLTEEDELNLKQRGALKLLKADLVVLREQRRKLREKITAITDTQPFGRGQPKNKIAALPRASLADAFGILPKAVQTLLARSKNREIVIDGLADDLEENFGLDFAESFSLESTEKGKATLIEYVRGGLGSGKSISQQVLFGGMNEVGIDTTTAKGKTLLPMEFRSILRSRVSWERLRKTDAPKVLAWAQDPATNVL
ncbi:MAG TPA: hypothetical protein VGD98_01060 [Ktedonobacteraceae bacterium]